MTPGREHLYRSPCLKCELRDADKDCRQCRKCRARFNYANQLDPDGLTRNKYSFSYQGSNTAGNRGGNPKNKNRFYNKIARKIDALNKIAYQGKIK